MLRGAIVDLDGTVYRGGRPIPGGGDGIAALREAGLALLYFSNNPVRDGAAYVSHLDDLGIDVGPGEAVSAADVTRDYLRQEHPEDRVFLVGSDRLRTLLADAGVRLAEDPGDADVLLASWTPQFGYEDMVDALRAVDPDTTFLGTDPDPTWPDEDGRLIPGSGAIIRALSGVVERDPDHILGKPSPEAVTLATERLGVDPADCLVVGDRLETDVALGERAGMTTILVLSGVTDRADLAESDVEPDHVIESLADVESVLSTLS